MIPKKVTEIGLPDIQNLIAGQVREGRTIEFKKTLELGTDSQKKEFLADVSSFANTGDGDLIYGLEAKDGIATAIVPLHIENIDAEVLRLESIVRTGVDPRFTFTVHPIPAGEAAEYVLLFRILESWNKPHRVVFGGSGKFYARSSAGKYELDVEELRQVFTLSNGIEKRMEDFRTERLVTIQTGGLRVPLASENHIVIHLLPLSSFSTKSVLPRDVLIGLEKESVLFQPMHSGSGWHAPRVNLEGVFCYSGSQAAHSYIQLFRNGTLELVESSILDRGDGVLIPYVLYEHEVVDGVKKGLDILKKVDIGAPILVCLSLLNVRGMRMSNSNHDRDDDVEHPIHEKNLILPGILLNDFDEDIAKALRPVFDLVWNACGSRQSRNYDKDGNFVA